MILLVKVHHIKIKSHVSCRNNKHYQVQEISVIRLLVGASGMIPKPLEVFIRTFNLPKYRVIDLLTTMRALSNLATLVVDKFDVAG